MTMIYELSRPAGSRNVTQVSVTVDMLERCKVNN